MNSEHEIAVNEKWFTPDWFDAISRDWIEYEQLAALGYSVSDIAKFYLIEPHEFERYFNMIDSPLKYHYTRGQLMQQAQEGMSMLRDAKTGENVMQAMRLDRRLYETEFKNTVDNIFFSSMNDV